MIYWAPPDWEDPEGVTRRFEKWACDRMTNLQPGVGVGQCMAAAVTADANPDALYAVILYHGADWKARTLQVSITAASPRWATRTNIRTLLGKPFLDWKVRKLWSVIASTNQRANNLCSGLGFKLEARLRHQYGHKVHAFCYGLMDTEFRAIWLAPRVKLPSLKVHHGQEVRSLAA